MSFARFASGFMQSFAQTRMQQQQQEEQKKEIKARQQLLEIELQREKRAQAAADEQMAARRDVFSKMLGGESLPGTGVQLMDPTKQGMSLTELLSDPEGAMSLLRAGMVNPSDLAKQNQEPDSVRLLRALAADPALAEVDRARKAAGASTTSINLDSQGLSKPPTGFFRPDPRQPGLQVEPGGPVEVETKLKKRDLDNALALYESAKEGLLKGLEATATGPLIGKLPAISSGQQTAQGSVAAMVPVMKQLFRAAGEGVFTDKDQELLIAMIPTRETNPQARASMLQNIDAIVRAKLGLGAQPQASGDVVDFNDLP